ncbi:MAG: transposase [Candidatus Nanoarchaeia archaeon]|nr:transposase [Candidatus Nanoarchaeia archaeon]
MEGIENELNKIFGSLSSCYSTKISYILSKLNLSLPILDAKNHIFSSESLIKIYLFKRIKGFSTYPQIEDYFNNNKREAYNLGFFKDDNDNLIFPKKRTFNEFLQKSLDKEKIMFLDKIVEKILSIATQNRVILDIGLVNKVIKEHKNKLNEKNKAFKEAVRLVKRLVYPQIEIKLRHNAKFTTRDLLDVLVHIAQTHDFCTNGVETFKELNPDIGCPARETILYHLKKLNQKEGIEETFRNIFDVIFEFSKKNYNLLNRRMLDVAIDIHEIPYYGDKADQFVMGGKQDKGTSNFFKFMTCSIVVAGRRFTIDALMIHPVDSQEDLVEKLIKRAKEKIHIHKVYLDRGFDKPSVIRILKQNNVKYLMPKIKSPTVKQWYDKSEDCKARVIKDFKIGDETTNLVLVDDQDGIKRAFSTNLDMPVPLTHYLFRFYSARWGIETKYRQLEHDFKPRTTSKNFHIRLFYFLFSTCLFNLWVLVNLCVSLAIYGRLIDKPLISSKLFAVVLYRVAYEDPP